MTTRLPGPNGALARSINRVVGAQTPTSVSMILQILSPSNPALKWRATFINYLSIVQNFSETFGDDITCEFKISPRDALILHENIDDLTASLRYTYIARNSAQKMLDIPPVIRTYRVMIKNVQDLRRTVQGAKGRIEPTMTLQLQLVDPLVYAIRQRVYYSTFSQTNIEGVLRHVAKSFGVTRFSLVPPDNVHVYDHVIIPASKTFAEVWAYIQNTYGVYFKGIRAYITDETLYVYPPYEHVRRGPNMAHIYLDEQGAHAGMNSYHRVKDGVVEVVLDGNPRVMDLSQMAGENTGTGVLFSRSDQILDGYMATDESGSRLTHSSSMIVNVKGAKTVGGDRFNVRQAPNTTDNVFALTSNLVAEQAEIIQGEWRQAVPGLLKPGHHLKYLYDDEGAMATSEGILEAAAYDFSRIGPVSGSDFAFAALGVLRFRIDPDHT